jgi:hypothetical protein
MSRLVQYKTYSQPSCALKIEYTICGDISALFQNHCQGSGQVLDTSTFANVKTYLPNVHVILKSPRYGTRRSEDGCTVTIFIVVDYFDRLKLIKLVNI